MANAVYETVSYLEQHVAAWMFYVLVLGLDVTFFLLGLLSPYSPPNQHIVFDSKAIVFLTLFAFAIKTMLVQIFVERILLKHLQAQRLQETHGYMVGAYGIVNVVLSSIFFAVLDGRHNGLATGGVFLILSIVCSGLEFLITLVHSYRNQSLRQFSTV